MALAESLMPTMNLIRELEHHSIVFFSGFETGDFTEWGTIVGSPTVQAVTKKTGDYAVRCTTSEDFEYMYGVNTGGRVSVYLYIASAPNDLTRIIGYATVNVRLTTDRYLRLYNAGTQKGSTGTTQLLMDTWYRISVSLDFDAANEPCKVYIDGSEEISANTDGGTGITDRVGIITSVTADLYFDDYVIDSTSSTDDLGDIRVSRASPNAAGQYAEFDTISGYDKCDEVPASDVDYVDDSGASVIHRETYNLQNCATIGVGASDTIKAVNILVRGYDSGNTAQGITVRDDGTDYETMVAFGKAFTWKNKLYDTNAPRAAPWTPAIFDAFQSGGYSEGSKDVYMSCVMVMVAFIPAVVAPAYKDIATRFKLILQPYQDVATRFRLSVQGYKDIGTRFTLWVAKDISTRFKLIVQSYQDTATRFKLTVQNFKDISTRFKLIAQSFQDVATRFKLWVQNYQDTSTRFKLTVRAYQDISTRFKLTVRNYKDVATRFKLVIGTLAYKDIATRFKLTVQGFQDVATRFQLAVGGYSDCSARFRLRAAAAFPIIGGGHIIEIVGD